MNAKSRSAIRPAATSRTGFHVGFLCSPSKIAHVPATFIVNGLGDAGAGRACRETCVIACKPLPTATL